MLPSGLVATVLGLATNSVSLPTILPQAISGCSLLVTPDVLGFAVNSGSVLTVSLVIPNAPVFISQQLHQQVVPLELDGQGGIVTATSSNRLTLTFGVF